MKKNMNGACAMLVLVGFLMPVTPVLVAEAQTSSHGAGRGKLFQPGKKLWRSQPDRVYLQEVGHRILTDKPVTAVAKWDGRVWAVVDGKAHVLTEQGLQPAGGAPEGIEFLDVLNGSLWAGAADGLYIHKGGGFHKADSRTYVGLCVHRGAVHGATKNGMYRYEEGKMVPVEPEGGYWSARANNIMEDGTQVLPDPVEWGSLLGLASYSETLMGLSPGNLSVLEGRVINKAFVDWGRLPSYDTRDILSVGSRVFIATDRGLGVLRGSGLTQLTGEQGLPIEDVTCLAKGAGTGIWIGTSEGAIRYTGGDFHFFGHQLWLPGPRVYDIDFEDNTAHIATSGGLAMIEYVPCTLAGKAAFYERHLREWGHKRLGFVSSLRWSSQHGQWTRVISDNDGSKTGDYLAAMSYKYAVTGDETAREEAVDAFEALVWMDEITPKPGFIARAIWGPGDKDHREQRGSGGLPADWYETDAGWWWKGDTSSDEVTGHFYAVALFHDLAAKGEEKQRAAVHLGRIAKHIVENGWVLRDMDGEPTRWGRWDPQYLLRPYGMGDRGLNGFEAQAFMITARELTGDAMFQRALEQTIDWGYTNYTWRQKIAFPPDRIVSHDDRLALQCYHPVMRYVKDPELRALYMRSIERTWGMKRIEHMAWWNYSYGAITGNDCDAAEAAQYLREWPLDCTSYSYKNSMRHDLEPEPGYPVYYGETRALSPRETGVVRGSRRHLRLNGGRGGNGVTDPSAWLMDYWMGRYHGFIEAPAADVPDLPSVTPPEKRPPGAPVYDGPPRPAIDYGATL